MIELVEGLADHAQKASVLIHAKYLVAELKMAKSVLLS